VVEVAIVTRGRRMPIMELYRGKKRMFVCLCRLRFREALANIMIVLSIVLTELVL